MSGSKIYRDAEAAMGVPPVSERGHRNENPKGIGFWALVREDFATHERNLFEQGFWAIFVNRFGNWRMGQPKIVRAPATLLYLVLFKLVEWFCGISLWYTVKMGRRVRIWHHSGLVIGARAIGDDVHLRQNTTIGVAQTWKNDELPIIGAGADIGAGACIAGAVYVGEKAAIGANALVITDIPDGATAMGNPAQVFGLPTPPEPLEEADPQETPASPDAAKDPAVSSDPAERMLAKSRDLGMITLLGSANLDYLAMNVTETAERFGISIRTHVPPFGQARMELMQEADQSDLLKAVDGQQLATLIVERAEDVLGDVYAAPLSLSPDDADAFLAEALQPMLQLIEAARIRLSGPVFVLGLTQIERSSLGLADGSDKRGLSALIARANDILAKEIAALSDVHMLSGQDIVAELGRQASQPGSYWHMARVPFSNPFGQHLARRVLGAILALRGQTARILVLDLDNTLWGGVLGEDGMEGVEIGGAYPGSAYQSFQRSIRALADRGIALAVASKNDEDLALHMMSEHPEMILRPGDLVAHRIGWDEKAIGIQNMLDEIGLGAASCMFIDDNPVERQKVRENIPDCIVPPFPDAPEDLAAWLLENPFLECVELTQSDLKRTQQYQVRAKVNAAKRDFKNIEEFYRDLEMRLTFEPYGPSNQKRALQLFVKTNQFNATLRRHDENAVQEILDRGGELYTVGVSDRYSAYELMGVLVLRPAAAMTAAYPDDAAVQSQQDSNAWWVDSFLLSCRILGRTIEEGILAWATARVAEKGGSALIGQIIEAPRNTPVRGVFSKSGFETVKTDLDLGAGGLYRHDLAGGPLALPDYFEVGDTPPEVSTPAPAASARPKAPKTATALPKTPVVPVAKPQAANPQLEARLAETFRNLLNVDATTDLESATMETLPQWDSLNHVKLAMEIELKLGIRLPGGQFNGISRYSDLKNAVLAQVRSAA